MRTVAIGGEVGGEIVVHELGDGAPGSAEVRDLLLVHGTGLHGRVWSPLVSHLPQPLLAGALAMDVRGHGESTPLPPGGLAWEELAADVLAVVDDLDLRRPLAVGHSSGASLLLLAEQLRPETFAGLYCIEPIGSAEEEPPPPNPAHPLAEGARRRRQEFPSRQAAFDTYAAKPPFAQIAPEALWAYVEHGFEDMAGAEGGVRLRCQAEGEAAMYAHGLSHHAYGGLPHIRCPVTVACGDRSAAVSADVMLRWAERLGNGRLEILPGLGHFAPLEDPLAVARAVTAALP